MAIQWSEDLSVGVKEIDEQHQEFVSILNNLYEFIYQSKNREELGILLGQLASYADKHFKTEEKYFDQFNYEFAEEHKEEHRKLTQKVVDFQASFLAGEKEINVELVDFLEDWLVHHLGNHDKKYMQCFKDNGLV
jgi:hemerythrin-like metal-binding protein